MFVVSLEGTRVVEFRSMSIMTPEVDLMDDGVYKIYVSGSSVAEYKTFDEAKSMFENILKALEEDKVLFRIPKV